MSDTRPVGGLVPWMLSGNSAPALRGQARRLAAPPAQRPELDPAEVGYSLANSRPVADHRAVVIGESGRALIDGVEQLARGELAANVVAGAASMRAARGTVVLVC